MADTLIKKSRVYHDFLKEVERGLSNTYLVISADAVAVDALFRLTAEAVAMRASTDKHAAVEKIRASSHPDIKFYENVSKLNVKDSEAIIEDVGIKSAEGAFKLYFLCRADGISQTVQNKLLKTLEEPPEKVAFFISVASETALLPTIRSRAKKFYLEAFSTKDLKDELLFMDADETTAETAAIAAAGSLTDAMRYATDETFLSLHQDVFELLLNLKKSSEIPSRIGSALFTKENVQTTLDLIERIVWDAVKMAQNATDGQKNKSLQEIGEGISPAAAAAISDKINEARKKISLNISPQTAAETLLFGILEAKFQWQ